MVLIRVSSSPAPLSRAATAPERAAAPPGADLPVVAGHRLDPGMLPRPSPPDPSWSSTARISKSGGVAGAWQPPMSKSTNSLVSSAPVIASHALVDLVASAPALSPVLQTLAAKRSLVVAKLPEGPMLAPETRPLKARLRTSDEILKRRIKTASWRTEGSSSMPVPSEERALRRLESPLSYPWWAEQPFGLFGRASVVPSTAGAEVAALSRTPLASASSARMPSRIRTAASPVRRRPRPTGGIAETEPGGRRLGTAPPRRAPEETMVVALPRPGILRTPVIKSRPLEPDGRRTRSPQQAREHETHEARVLRLERLRSYIVHG